MMHAYQSDRRFAVILISLAALAACSTGDAQNFEPQHPWLGDGSAPIAISHEGIRHESGRIHEQGFVDARNLGFTYMETDLRQLQSGELVAYHDVGGNVENMTLEALNSQRHTDDTLLPPVPEALSLLEASDLVDVRWNFELKGGDVEVAEQLSQIISETNSRDRVCVSFGINVRVAEMRNALPAGICMCATILERSLDWDILAGNLDSIGIDDRVVCTQMASEPFRGSTLLQVDKRDVRRAHERSLALHVYDVLGLETSKADVERWLDLDVDGIITDDHQVLAEVFRERGLWPSE